MEITRIRMLRGPNLWSRHTALEAIVSCDESERSIDSIPQFESKIRERFPQLGSMRRGGQNEVLSLAHALEYAALGLQAQAGCPVTFSRQFKPLMLVFTKLSWNIPKKLLVEWLLISPLPSFKPH